GDLEVRLRLDGDPIVELDAVADRELLGRRALDGLARLLHRGDAVGLALELRDLPDRRQREHRGQEKRGHRRPHQVRAAHGAFSSDDRGMSWTVMVALAPPGAMYVTYVWWPGCFTSSRCNPCPFTVSPRPAAWRSAQVPCRTPSRWMRASPGVHESHTLPRRPSCSTIASWARSTDGAIAPPDPPAP